MAQVSAFYERNSNNSTNVRSQITERVMSGSLKIIDEKKIPIDNDKVQMKETKKEGNIRRNNEITTKGSLSLSGHILPVSSAGDGLSQVPVQRPVAVAPEVKFTDLPEYRSAYLQALNEGLAGQPARDRARGLLEFVLPKTTLSSILKEENQLEAFKNQSYSSQSPTCNS
jgi:hypothetical protein